MELILDDKEIRVLGSLVEKQLATPEYYPMSVNSLTAACNQKTNRDPVVEYSEDTIRDALESLREKGLATKLYGPAVRVPKHRHLMDERLRLGKSEMAVMAVLMLRGAQTIGEVRARAERMFEFREMAEVEAVLKKLMERSPDPLVTRIPRQAGHREDRYAHLLSGEVAIPEAVDTPPHRTSTGPARDERIEQLEEEVAALKDALEALQTAFNEFRRSFQ